MGDERIAGWLSDLKNPDESVRDSATQALWHHWFYQKGASGFTTLQRSEALIQEGALEAAEALLTQTIGDSPDFAEAWNRRAVLYYLQGEYQRSLSDCRQVLRLNPIHFGALHGMGLCYAALGEYRQAIQTFHQALEIQPYATLNQRLILECTARLS